MTLKSFIERHGAADLKADSIAEEIARLEERADNLEYHHFRSQSHLDAAAMLRADAASLKTLHASALAGRGAIDGFQPGKSYNPAELVRDRGAIWRCRGLTTDRPCEGKSWELVAGTPTKAPQAATTGPAVFDYDPVAALQNASAETKDVQALHTQVIKRFRDVTKHFDDARLALPVSYRVAMFDDAVLRTLISKEFRDRDETIDALRQRVEALEAGGISYAGTYQRAMPYSRGAMVTHKGSMWAALKSVPAGVEPGDPDHWQLAVKAGRDGRDANSSSEKAGSK